MRPGTLRKVECDSCGVVANASHFSEQEVLTLYGDEYALNTSGAEEHLFFTKDGPIARSEVFCQWIAPHFFSGPQRALEIGSGQGNLLARLSETLPQAKFSGIEGSHRAAELARSRGLDVRQGLVTGNTELPAAETIFSVNVLEHIEDIDGFLATIRRSLAASDAEPSAQRLVLCLPIQNYYGYDLFFLEHVWHFTVDHVQQLLGRRGFKVLHCEHQHPINHGIGLFVCQPLDDSVDNGASVDGDYPWIRNNRDRWHRVFAEVNTWLETQPADAKIAVFGGGEVFALFRAFTRLGERRVVACIDEDPAKVDQTIESDGHNIIVGNIEWLRKNPVDALLLTLNPKYHGMVKDKLASVVDRVFSWSPYDPK
ncbi:MAG: class I SAM-dependent methyltransferase [Deltaproteobacteria bacterium]|nr:class I SAM-dependent methyltransferase [Deltaproteobacteria bacterium]